MKYVHLREFMHWLETGHDGADFLILGDAENTDDRTKIYYRDIEQAWEMAGHFIPFPEVLEQVIKNKLSMPPEEAWKGMGKAVVGQLIGKVNARDPITKLHPHEYKSLSLELLKCYRETRSEERSMIMSVDMTNLRGLNLALSGWIVDRFHGSDNKHVTPEGRNSTDQVLFIFSRVFENSIKAVLGTAAKVYLYRDGGDEFSAILPDCNPQQAGKIKKRIKHEIAALVAEWGVDDIPHAKYPSDISKRGTGLSCGYVQIKADSERADLLATLEELVEKDKEKGRNTRNGEESGWVGRVHRVTRQIGHLKEDAAFRHKPEVAAACREKIQRTSEQLGYAPSPPSRQETSATKTQGEFIFSVTKIANNTDQQEIERKQLQGYFQQAKSVDPAEQSLSQMLLQLYQEDDADLDVRKGSSFFSSLGVATLGKSSALHVVSVDIQNMAGLNSFLKEHDVATNIMRGIIGIVAEHFRAGDKHAQFYRTDRGRVSMILHDLTDEKVAGIITECTQAINAFVEEMQLSEIEAPRRNTEGKNSLRYARHRGIQAVFGASTISANNRDGRPLTAHLEHIDNQIQDNVERGYIFHPSHAFGEGGAHMESIHYPLSERIYAREAAATNVLNEMGLFRP